jgi:hypothetical protein
MSAFISAASLSNVPNFRIAVGRHDAQSSLYCKATICQSPIAGGDQRPHHINLRFNDLEHVVRVERPVTRQPSQSFVGARERVVE